MTHSLFPSPFENKESFGERPTSPSSSETSSLLPSPGRVVVASGSKHAAASAKRGHLGKAIFYGVQVFYSFFIMLLFMTYNGWVMVAVAVGASLGYLVWGAEEAATKSVACH
jgi:copper transporter 1